MTTKKNLRTTAYESILDNILSGDLKPGHRINTSEMAKRLSISPTPVREALLQLCQEKLIVSDGRSGFSVKRMQLSELKEYVFYRKILETTSAKLIVKNITEQEIDGLETVLKKMKDTYKTDNFKAHRKLHMEFHKIIWEAARSDLYCNLLRCMNNIFVHTIVFITSKKEIIENSILEHHKILECIKAKDIKRLEELFHRHIDGVEEHCTPYFLVM